MDNFNKNLSWKIPDVDKGVYTGCNWTGVAIREYTAAKLSLLTPGDGGGFYQAMPKDVFKYHAEVRQWFLNAVEHCDRPFFKYNKSLVMNWHAHNIPIKPDPANVPERYRDAVASKNCALDTLYPAMIMEHNIGSTLGLARVFRHFYDETMAKHPADRLVTIINCDTNIFKRIIKVPHCCVCERTVSFVHVVCLTA